MRVSVEDTGIGISENQLTKLFETFGNCEDATASNYGDDVGLGLPLAQRYSRLMGGELLVESTRGVGSKFTVEVPIRRSESVTLPGTVGQLVTEAAC